MRETIDYGALMHTAMRDVIAQVLQNVSQYGLPGNHHFFITFDTQHPGVHLSDTLREKYPDEMTIVLQHEFYDLTVTKDVLSVSLSFSNTEEKLRIPLTALKTFVDPSVEFGLRFETVAHETTQTSDEAAEPPKTEAEIVQLDRFRKGD